MPKIGNSKSYFFSNGDGNPFQWWWQSISLQAPFLSYPWRFGFPHQASPLACLLFFPYLFDIILNNLKIQIKKRHDALVKILIFNLDFNKCFILFYIISFVLLKIYIFNFIHHHIVYNNQKLLENKHLHNDTLWNLQ
jgi:hypothetical protein